MTNIRRPAYTACLRRLCLAFCFVIAPQAFTDTGGIGANKTFESRMEWQQKQEPSEYRDFHEKFVVFFNAKDRRPWTPMLSAKLRNPAKLVSSIKYIHRQHGDISQLRFKYFDRRKQPQQARWLAVYLAEFSTGDLMEFRFGIDSENRMEKMIFTKPNFNEALPELASKTPLRWPFSSATEWYVLWGGLTEDLNYHATDQSQRNALDLLIKQAGNPGSHLGDGKNNEDYYAFGKTVLSPADGRVIEVVDGIADNIPGQINPDTPTGNTIVIATPHDEYLLLGQLQRDSIKVSEGQIIESGQALAQVGNSGNSSEPHLHLQLMNAAKMSDATGIRMRFGKLLLNHESSVWNYAPIRTNVISYPAD